MSTCVSGLLIGALLCIPALGQTFGEITGEVKDAAGAVVVGAVVTVANPATNATRETLTTDAGLYSFPALQPGAYTLKVAWSLQRLT